MREVIFQVLPCVGGKKVSYRVMMNFLCSSESSRPHVDVQTAPPAEQIKRHKRKEIDQKEMKIETGRSYM